MRKLWLVFKREYLTRVRSKAFIISTVAVPLVTVGYFIFIAAIASRHADRTLKIAIVDHTGGLAPSVSKGLAKKLPNGQPEFMVTQAIDRPEAQDPAVRDLLAQVRQGRLDAYLVLPKGTLEGAAAEFHTKNPGDLVRTASLQRALNDAVIAQRLKDRGIDTGDVGKIVRGLDLKMVKVTQQGEAEEKGQTFFTAIIAAMVLYMTMVIYGVSTMRSVLEEKTTRIVEILASSIAPFQLLSGKILGVGAAALTQYLIWTVSGGVLAAYGSTMASTLRPDAPQISIHLPASLLVYLVLYFLGGYFLYASLFAAIGSMVSSEQDAQQLQLPVTIPIILSIMLFNLVLRDPNSTTSVVLSLIPLFSPTLMLFRIALQTPPFWQIALSLVLLALTTAGTVYLSGRIYRVGILMYGKRPSLVEVARWLRYS